MEEIKKEERIDFIINSYSPADHSSGNWMVDDVPIYVPQEEFFFNGNVRALSERYAGEGFRETWRRLVTRVMGFRESPLIPFQMRLSLMWEA